MKSGYCITTKKFTLRCKHPQWFAVTQELYNQILFFYYQLLLKHPDYHSLNNQQILRSMEVLTIMGRDKNPVPDPLPWDKVPLYFRRAAINGAIGMVKSYLNRKGFTNQAAAMNASVVYYKGMYRELTSEKVWLKVYDGSSWHWMHCRLSGNELLKDAEPMSPTVVIETAGIRQENAAGDASVAVSLHVPVREAVEDARTSKERMAAGEKICSVQFTNSDAFAVACIMDSGLNQVAVRFFKGGGEYSHHCAVALEKIQKSEASRGGIQQEDERTNQKYWMHLKHLREHYAHQVSRQIVDYCKEKGAKTIVMAAVDGKLTGPVLKAAGKWSTLHLSTRIKEYLSYKAWRSGIVVLEIQPKHAGRVCCQCGRKIRKKKEMFECENGHTGNRYVNTARNLGKMCLEDFGKKIKGGNAEGIKEDAENTGAGNPKRPENLEIS